MRAIFVLTFEAIKGDVAGGPAHPDVARAGGGHGRGGTAKGLRRWVGAARHRDRPSGQRLRRGRPRHRIPMDHAGVPDTTWPRRWRTSATGSFGTTAPPPALSRSARAIRKTRWSSSTSRVTYLLILWVCAHNMNASRVTPSMPCAVTSPEATDAVRRGCTHVTHRSRHQHRGRDHRGGRDDRAVQVQSGRVAGGRIRLPRPGGRPRRRGRRSRRSPRDSATSWPRSAC